MHAAFGNPALSTFQHAVRSHYLPSLLRFTISNVLAHSPHTISTALGHLDQTQQGQRSTNRFISLFNDKPTEDAAHDIDSEHINYGHANHTYTHVYVLTDTMHSDLTGKFSVTSR